MKKKGKSWIYVSSPHHINGFRIRNYDVDEVRHLDSLFSVANGFSCKETYVEILDVVKRCAIIIWY